MFKLIRQSGWFSAVLILSMPVLLVFLLASQMAYSQVKGRFDAYQAIPEIARMSDLERVPAGQVIMLRGRIAAGNAAPGSTDLVVYRERPAEGREVRFQEEFPLVFPAFALELPAGAVQIEPSLNRDLVIYHELHRVEVGDRERTGFRPGDTVTVQGQWQPARLFDVTGITGADKAALLQEFRQGLETMGQVRNVLGILTFASIMLLVIQWRRARTARPETEAESWQTPETGTVPTASP